ncbi:MAG: Gfo/Idh/MocA family oxidoreductase [Chloroflexi bacterium]|nr:Gfo/Idh/MocA family oxidoreductase [Chloroflexota bacterium]
MRFGIVGLASRYWPAAFARAAGQIRGVELRAAADLGRTPTEMRATLGMDAAAFAERFGVRLYRDAAEMIANEGLDAAFVCAEPTAQADLVELACRAGVHVYIAKPLATTLADADRIVRAVREAGVVASTGNTERFDGALREAHRVVRSGAIGDLLMVRTLHQHGSIDGFGPDDWYRRPEQGGPELSLLWYVADVLSWFVGAPVARVYAEYDNFATPGSPFMDNGKAIFRFANRVLGSFDIYFAVRGFQMPRWEIELVGTRGALRTQQSSYEGTLFTADGPRSFYRNQNDAVLAEVQHWVDCCREGNEPEVAVEHARNVIEIALACRRSNEQHRPVELPLDRTED